MVKKFVRKFVKIFVKDFRLKIVNKLVQKFIKKILQKIHQKKVILVLRSFACLQMANKTQPTHPIQCLRNIWMVF